MKRRRKSPAIMNGTLERFATAAAIPLVILASFGGPAGLGNSACAVESSAATSAQAKPHIWESERIFPYQQAEKARRLAQKECKPLVIHFIPDTKVGGIQLDNFYSGARRVPDDLLDDVVIVVVPSERFKRFARELGVTGAGGYRTVSAYDLTAFKEKSQPTCKSGFR